MTGGMMLFKEQSYQDKIESALGCISAILEDIDPEDCIIAFSGGKDSTVLLELVRFLAPNCL
jgi:tRNA(Ile)-lysidine synthase TilS/MesJ